jgi:HD-like signal output (HDOD) protein
MPTDTLSDLDQAGVDRIVASIQIPPCPTLLRELQTEIRKQDPDPRIIAAITAQDVALSAAVIKVVNSPFYGLRNPVNSLSEAVLFLGLLKIAALVSSLVIRETLDVAGPSLVRFWDASAKRALTMQYLSLRLKVGEPDIAQTFGLFCDLGIPLLAKKFPDYFSTLARANVSKDLTFTEVERNFHGTDHARAGALMAKSWGLSPLIVEAIRRHHDYDHLSDSHLPAHVRDLIAMGLLAERLIQAHTDQNQTVEWGRGGEGALARLKLSLTDFDALKVELRDKLAAV